MSAIDQIKSMLDLADPFRDAPENLREIQLEALRERFAEKRSKIKILDRRANDAGLDAIESLQDVVPLLFSHTNYKSYPESFVDNGQWANMNLWLQTLTSKPVTGVDMNDIKDADDWINRLADAGHHLFASSGTSGKCSFLDQTSEDIAIASKAYDKSFLGEWAPKKPNHEHISFIFFPPAGVHRLCEHSKRFFTKHAAPEGEVHFMSNERLLASPGIRGGQLRRAIAAGTALPEEISQFEAENQARANTMDADVKAVMDKIYDNRNKPLAMGLMWPQAFQIVEAMRARGVKDGEFHPNTIMMMGGGIKGIKLPDDYKEQIFSFFNLAPENFLNTYAMVEMTGLSPFYHHIDGYALPPWIIPLILDKTAEKLLNPEDCEGEVEGRMAFFDLLTDARWGGLISGDKVVVDFTKTDGFAGPIVKSVARYQDLEEGEDKLTCAGTIDSYVRGAVEL